VKAINNGAIVVQVYVVYLSGHVSVVSV